MQRIARIFFLLLTAWWAADVPAASAGGAAQFSNVRVFAQNDLGMHCVDKDFSVFSILPPYNVLNADVIGQNANGSPVLLDSSQVTLQYSPVADATGSINSTSAYFLSGPSQGALKSNFWTYAQALFGLPAALPLGQGLTGLSMPMDATSKAGKSLSWNSGKGMFSAEGVPILPWDDAGKVNHYPLLKVSAYDKASGKLLASNTPVLPVSEETTCSGCHDSGGAGTPDNRGIAWSKAGDTEVRVRENILLLHDFNHAGQIQTTLNKPPLMQSKPVLCAGCHYSAALDLAGSGPNDVQKTVSTTMSGAMHAYHADLMPPPLLDDYVLPGAPLPDAADQSCYQCHPGKETKCLRGAMSETVTCQNCHGDMAAVGGGVIDTSGSKTLIPLPAGGGLDGTADGKSARRPWKDLPECQSCHIGDALKSPTLTGAIPSADGIRLQLAFNPADASASPYKSSSSRFAENSKTLFRFSKGHGGVACESCHGSTHAIWPADPSLNPNDNLAAKKLQGHVGTIMECSTCHKLDKLPLTLNGPHGMHNVGQKEWINGGHEEFYEKNPSACQSCHGKDLKGTVLSRVAANRTYATEFGTVTVKKGEPVGCYTCHNGPRGGDDD